MYFTVLVGFDTGEGKAGGFTARVKLEHDGLQRAIFQATIFQPNAEWLQTVHDCSFAREQQPCAFFRAGHQRFLMTIDDKHTQWFFPSQCWDPVRGW
jgi:hypothetical protein